MSMMTDNNAGFDLDDDDTADAFGPGAGHAASNDDDFDEYDAPPMPIGVLPARVKSAKKLAKGDDNKTFNFIIEFECTDPRFSAAETVSLFAETPKFSGRILQVAAALGIVVPQVAGKVRTPKPAALVGKECLVVYSTYVDARDSQTKSTIAWGYPDGKNKSELFDEWAAEQHLTDDQKALIKKSPGVLPVGSL